MACFPFAWEEWTVMRIKGDIALHWFCMDGIDHKNMMTVFTEIE
jgi:hypothetical protein